MSNKKENINLVQKIALGVGGVAIIGAGVIAVSSTIEEKQIVEEENNRNTIEINLTDGPGDGDTDVCPVNCG